jgi:hypothetical protein
MVSLEERIELTEVALRRTAVEQGMRLTGDLRVSEADAAELLCLSVDHLSQMRREGRAPPDYGRGMAGCRVSYRLSDIASWIEAGRQDY